MTSWRDLAACRGYPTTWWFPADGNHRYDRARAVCAVCPVRLRCLAVAVRQEGADVNSRYGMWGGLTPEERRALRQGRRTA